MANRRMFSNRIIDRAAFLRLSPPARLLYYDLGMKADDDGFVEAFTVMRTTGAGEDDLRALEAKGFVVVINDDLLTWIPDWLENNQIKNDRYHPSMHRDLLPHLQAGTKPEPTRNQDGTNVEPEVTLSQVTQLNNRIVESSLQDADRDQYVVKNLPVRLKEYLTKYEGFKELSIGEIAKLLQVYHFDPEVIVWIAGKAVDNAEDSPTAYFWAAINDKCQYCRTLKDLFDCEGDDEYERQHILKIVNDLSVIRDSIEEEWKQQS